MFLYCFSRMLISNVHKSTIVMNSLNTRFSKNVFEAVQKTRSMCFIGSKTTRLCLVVLNRIKHSCLFFKHYMKFRSLTPSQFLRALKMFLFTKYINNRQSFFWLASVLFFFFNQFEF